MYTQTLRTHTQYIYMNHYAKINHYTTRDISCIKSLRERVLLYIYVYIVYIYICTHTHTHTHTHALKTFVQWFSLLQWFSFTFETDLPCQSAPSPKKRKNLNLKTKRKSFLTFASESAPAPFLFFLILFILSYHFQFYFIIIIFFFAWRTLPCQSAPAPKSHQTVCVCVLCVVCVHSTHNTHPPTHKPTPTHPPTHKLIYRARERPHQTHVNVHVRITYVHAYTLRPN